MMRRSRVLLAMMLAIIVPVGDLSAAWVMQTPASGATYSTNATVSTAGTTHEHSVGFTVDVVKNAGGTEVIMNSGNGTTTSMGSYFSCSVPAPSGGWTVTVLAWVDVYGPNGDGTSADVRFQ